PSRRSSRSLRIGWCAWTSASTARTGPCSTATERWWIGRIRFSWGRATNSETGLVQHAQAVAHAWLSDEQDGAGGVGLDLAAQVADGDAQEVEVPGALDAPDLAEQHGVGENLAGLFDQGDQEIVFGGRQGDREAILGDVAGGEVDFEGAGAED